MTVVIGIRCQNGIVLGADGAATFMSQGIPSAQQRSMRKLTARGTVLTGFAGHHGLAQRLRGEIESALEKPGDGLRTDQILQQLRRQLWSGVIQLELTAAAEARESLRIAGCEASAHCEMLVAGVLNRRPELIHFNEQGAPAVVEDDVPYIAIGAGQAIAYPFIGFARRVFWSDGLPSLATGTFSVVWTLTHVADSNSIGISGPFQLAILEQNDDGWIAREVSTEEMNEHRDRVQEAEGTLKAWASGKPTTQDTGRIHPPR